MNSEYIILTFTRLLSKLDNMSEFIRNIWPLHMSICLWTNTLLALFVLHDDDKCKQVHPLKKKISGNLSFICIISNGSMNICYNK